MHRQFAGNSGKHLQPEVYSAGLVVGTVVIVVLLVGVYGQTGNDVRCDKVQAPVRVQLLLRAAEQPRQLPWLLRSLEAAADAITGCHADRRHMPQRISVPE